MKLQHPLDWLTEKLLEYARRPLYVSLRRQFGPQPNQRELAEAFGRRALRHAFEHNKEVVLDFADVGLITQAFFHALLDDVITEDVRRAGRIRLVNVTKPQKAVFDLALKYMVTTAAPRRPDVPPTPTEFAHSK